MMENHTPGKRDSIISAAEQLFAGYGIKKTTMEDIAKKVHMGKSTVYYYFKSKEEIFAEVIKKDSGTFKVELERAIAAGETPHKKISDYVRARMIYLRRLTSYYSTLTDEYFEQYRFVENIRKDFVDYEIAVLSGLLEEGVGQGLFSIENIGSTARMIIIILKGLEQHLMANRDEDDIETESRQMLHILFKGIENTH